MVGIQPEIEFTQELSDVPCQFSPNAKSHSYLAEALLCASSGREIHFSLGDYNFRRLNPAMRQALF